MGAFLFPSDVLQGEHIPHGQGGRQGEALRAAVRRGHKQQAVAGVQHQRRLPLRKFRRHLRHTKVLPALTVEDHVSALRLHLFHHIGRGSLRQDRNRRQVMRLAKVPDASCVVFAFG